MKETGQRGDRTGDSQTSILTCVCVCRSQYTHLHRPPQAHTKDLSSRRKDKSPSVSANKIVNILDWENMNVSTKLGNKKNQ